MALHVETTYSVKVAGATWRVAQSDLCTITDECGQRRDFIRLTSHGFARFCFGVQPLKWVSRSEGMNILMRCRNDVAFEQLYAAAAAFADTPTSCAKRRRTRATRGELNAKRTADKETIEVKVPSVGGMAARTITMVKPVLPTDVLFVDPSVESLTFCHGVICHFKLQAEIDVEREELPVGVWWQSTHRRYVVKWFDDKEAVHRYKVFRASAETAAAKSTAKAEMEVFVANPAYNRADDIGDEVGDDDVD